MLGMASRALGSFLSLPHSWAASVDSDLTIGIVGTGWRTDVRLPRGSPPPLSPELRSACGRGPSDRSAGFWREALRRSRTASRAPASSSRTTSPSTCSRLFPNTVVSTLKFVHCLMIVITNEPRKLRRPHFSFFIIKYREQVFAGLGDFLRVCNRDEDRTVGIHRASRSLVLEPPRRGARSFNGCICALAASAIMIHIFNTG